MKKNLSINTSSRSKPSDIEKLEREFRDHPPDDQIYRFTAVLPEPVGRELRVYCAWRNLKLKDALAEAVVDFLDKKRNQASSGDKPS